MNGGAAHGVSIGDMRNTLASLGLVLAMATPALADDGVAGTYTVKFEQVSTNCSSPIAYHEFEDLKIVVKGNNVEVDIDRTPTMAGKPGKAGKVNVKSKPGHTPIQQMDGTFSLAGRISPEGMVSLVMVGEYTQNGKPLCTQSWNLSGRRKDGK
jgi:hypothetical protein